MAKNDIETMTYEALTTPAGPVLYPYIFHHDEYKGVKKFKITLVLDKDEHADFIASIDDMVENSYQEAKAILNAQVAEAKGKKKIEAQAKLGQLVKAYPYSDHYEEDEDGEAVETNCVEFCFTTYVEAKDKKTGDTYEKMLPVFDARGKAIKDTKLRVGNGSICKVRIYPKHYLMDSSVSAGVKLYLNAVQIIKLEEFSGNGGSAGAYGFGDEGEGYEADAYDTGGESAGDPGNGDF